MAVVPIATFSPSGISVILIVVVPVPFWIAAVPPIDNGLLNTVLISLTVTIGAFTWIISELFCISGAIVDVVVQTIFGKCLKLGLPGSVEEGIIELLVGDLLTLPANTIVQGPGAVSE